MDFGKIKKTDKLERIYFNISPNINSPNITFIFRSFFSRGTESLFIDTNWTTADGFFQNLENC